MRFFKDLCVPAEQGRVPLLGAATLRIPTVTVTGCKSRWMVLSADGRACGTQEETFGGTESIQWVEVRLTDVPVASGLARLAVEVKVQGGELHVIVDEARCYQRTWLLSATGQAETIPMEAAVELSWDAPRGRAETGPVGLGSPVPHLPEHQATDQQSEHRNGVEAGVRHQR